MVIADCLDCGNAFERPRNRNWQQCFECRQRRMYEALLSVHERAGPQYERIVRRQLAHWVGESERLGLS